MMMFLKQGMAKPIQQAAAMTPELLREIYNMVNVLDVVEVVCFTAVLVGFYLFLHKSNLVPDSVLIFDPSRQSTTADVILQPYMVLMNITWTKTIQYKQRTLTLPHTFKIQRDCAIFWVQHMLARVPGAPQDLLFSIPKRGANVPLTYEQLRKMLKKWVEDMGRQSDIQHTVRRGTTHALRSGITGEEIRLTGDWASNAYLRYLDINLDRRVQNMVQFMDSM